MHYPNVAIWISWNIDIGRNLNFRDSLTRRKFKNRAPTSCSPGPILLPTTINFELHAKTAEEIDLEKCTFRNFGSSVSLTLTLDRVEVTQVRISGWGLPTYKIRWKSEKNFLWTYGRTDIGSRWPNYCYKQVVKNNELEMWADAQPDCCPAEYRRHPLFNAANLGWRPLLVPFRNAAKTRNLLKFTGVPQTNETISAASGPKLTILWVHVEYILLLNKFFFNCRYVL